MMTSTYHHAASRGKPLISERLSNNGQSTLDLERLLGVHVSGIPRRRMHEIEIHPWLKDHAMRAASIMEHAEFLAFNDFISLFDRELAARDFCHADKDDRLVD